MTWDCQMPLIRGFDVLSATNSPPLFIEGSDIFLNFILMSLTEVPAYVAAITLIQGRDENEDFGIFKQF